MTTGCGTFGIFNDVVDAFRSGQDNPTRVLSYPKANKMMDDCNVPSDWQEEFIEVAIDFSLLDSSDYE